MSLTLLRNVEGTFSSDPSETKNLINTSVSSLSRIDFVPSDTVWRLFSVKSILPGMNGAIRFSPITMQRLR